MKLLYDQTGKLLIPGAYINSHEMLLRFIPATSVRPFHHVELFSDQTGYSCRTTQDLGWTIRDTSDTMFSVKLKKKICRKCDRHPTFVVKKHGILLKKFDICLNCYKRGISNVGYLWRPTKRKTPKSVAV